MGCFVLGVEYRKTFTNNIIFYGQLADRYA